MIEMLLSCYTVILLQIFKHKEKIQDISTTASNEATLESMLQKVMTLFSSFSRIYKNAAHKNLTS